MMTELFIEGYPVDLTGDLSALLTFQVDDVRDFGARNTAFSKTIVLPGTSNNNRLLGHVFMAGQANPYLAGRPNILTNFNAAKSASAYLFQGNLQVFKGVVRLLEIISDRGAIEYEVALFGELGGLMSAIGNRKLEDLDFSAYNHDYTIANIVASWNSWNAGEGYYYPLIDYGNYSTNKHDWDYHTFRPALFVREYLNKIFAAANYRYACDLFDTARFKTLIVPHNQAKLRSSTPTLASVTLSSAFRLLYPPTSNGDLSFSAITAADFTIVSSNRVQYNGASPTAGDVSITINGQYACTPFAITITLYQGSTPIAIGLLPATVGSSNIPFTLPLSATSVTFTPGDQFRLTASAGGSSYELTIYAGGVFKVTATEGLNAELNLGNKVELNATLPKNILQKDFVSSIVKLFNLYVYEDRHEERKLLIKPYVDFYNTDPATFIDWSHKLNRDRPVRLKPMSELNARYYEFKMKSDSDYYNDLYNKRYNQTYGSRKYDSEFEFAKDSHTVEVIFSGTPLVGYPGEEKVYSTILKRSGTTTITEENVDSNIRLLQAKKVTGVASWDIKNGSTVLGSYTDYPYAGHLNDPDAPANDLNFGTPKELFFTLAAGALNVNQFNVYYSSYMAEITHKDSKLLTASFRLSLRDIYELDFSKLVWIDGVLWRLNKIQDYNATAEDDCRVEMLKVIDLVY